MRFRTFVMGVASVFMSSCGYHYTSQQDSSAGSSITIPYIDGDLDATLNNALVYQLSASGQFAPVQSGGDLTLKIEILSDEKSRIGFRYDRDNVKGAREKNLLGSEDRRLITVQVSLFEVGGGQPLIEPFKVSAFADYDYIDPGSPEDLLYTPSSGSSQSVIQFSLGQLDSYEGASDDASSLVFRKIAKKVTLILVNKLPEVR